MNCTEVRSLLPGNIYGDLSDVDAAAVARHLRDCPACRAEAAALEQVRLAMDVPASPPVRVDVAALFHEVAERRARRWRRLAVAGAVLAAALLLVVGLRLQVAVASDQVVISWGDKASRGREPPGSLVADKNQGAHAPRSPEHDDRLRDQQELLHALVADVDARDRRQQSEIAALRSRQNEFQRVVLDRFADFERMTSALYVAQFKRPEEKPNP